MINNPDKAFVDMCRKIDFSAESVNRDENLENLKKLLNDNNIGDSNIKGENIMKKKPRKIIAIAAAASLVLCLTLSAVYAEELYRIIKTVMLGNHATYTVVEDNRESIPLPEGLNIKLYDEDGNEATARQAGKQLFNAEGEPMVIDFNGENFVAITAEEYQRQRNEANSNYLTFYDISDDPGYFICDVLMPGYLPEGYSFNRMEYYVSAPGELPTELNSEKYINVYYSNGVNEMYEQIRYMDAETAFESSGDTNIQKINIGGNEAVINGKCLDIQIGDVMYMLFGNDDINMEELIKIAESLTSVN